MDTWDVLCAFGFKPDSEVLSDDKPGLSLRINKFKVSASFCLNMRFAHIVLITGHVSNSNNLSDLSFQMLQSVESSDQCAAIFSWNWRGVPSELLP
jgi:hypothetical protein